jgi:phenylacetate-CoA ligase
MRRMERVSGRSDDMVIIRGVNLFPSQIEELVLADQRLAPHYQLEIRRAQRLDQLTVIAEARPEAADEVTRAAARRDLGHHIKSRIGITSEVRVLEPGAVDRSQGKARRVVDLRTQD